jgi:hypothetical protein
MPISTIGSDGLLIMGQVISQSTLQLQCLMQIIVP